MPKAKLIDKETGKEYILKGRVTSVGRKEDNDIVIRNRIVSKYHMEFRRSLTGGYTIADSGSTHGFYINKERAKGPVKLKPGDRIRVLIIYAGDVPDDTKGGTSTIVGRPQAIAKSRLDGSETNMSVACDFTFYSEGGGLLGMFSKKQESGE